MQMRIIQQDIANTINQVSRLKGMNVKLKVNRGRNRIETVEGMLENAYTSIFTVRTKSGDINSFSYSDILAKNIFFCKIKN